MTAQHSPVKEIDLVVEAGSLCHSQACTEQLGQGLHCAVQPACAPCLEFDCERGME